MPAPDRPVSQTVNPRLVMRPPLLGDVHAILGLRVLDAQFHQSALFRRIDDDARDLLRSQFVSVDDEVIVRVELAFQLVDAF